MGRDVETFALLRMLLVFCYLTGLFLFFAGLESARLSYVLLYHGAFDRFLTFALVVQSIQPRALGAALSLGVSFRRKSSWRDCRARNVFNILAWGFGRLCTTRRWLFPRNTHCI